MFYINVKIVFCDSILYPIVISITMYLMQLWAQFRMILYHWGSLPYFIMFTIVNYTLMGFQKFFWWRLTGVKAHLDKAYLNQCYESSAHVLTVLGHCKDTEFDKDMGDVHFIKIHHSFQHPEFVLSEDIFLLDVNYTKAVFMQLPRSLERYTVKYHPEMLLGLAKNALRLIEMPLDSFHRLADKVGHPDNRWDRVTFMFHSGRTGSTLVARMMEELDQDSIVFSEPSCLLMFVYYMKYAPKSFSYPALRSALYLLLKPISSKKRIVVKHHHFSSLLADYVHDILPSAKYIYCTRDPIRIIWGHERAFSISPMYKFIQVLIYVNLWSLVERYVGHYRNPMAEHFGENVFRATTFDTCFVVWFHMYTNYKRHSEKFAYPSVNYDNLLKNPEKFCMELAELLNVPDASLENAMNVLHDDSQADTVLSQGYLRYIPVTPYSAELKEKLDKFCYNMQIPLLNWEPYRKKTVYSITNGKQIIKHVNGK